MRKALFLALVACLAVVSVAVAQNTDIESLAGVQFNFANPGARSLGMGGAFLGLADDASAAEANPAGLTILRKPEVSVEGRNFRMSQVLNNRGVYPAITNQEFSSFSRSLEPTYASIVFPMQNFAIAGYYHEPLFYRNSGAVLQSFDSRTGELQNVPSFFLPRGTPPGSATPVSAQECQNIREAAGDNSACVMYELFPYATAVSLDMKTWGLSGAWKMGGLSLGAGVRYQHFREGAFTSRYDFDSDTGRFIPVSDLVQATFDKNGDIAYKTDTTYSAGFKYQIGTSFSIGGVYKEGAKFVAPVFLRTEGEAFQKLEDTTFHVPDVMGVGVSFRPLPVLTVNVDAVNIKYSNLTDKFRSANFGTFLLTNAYEAKDVTEYHAGAEYFFGTRIPFAIRGGWWRDPAHSVQYVGPLTCDDAAYDEGDRVRCAANRVTASILFPKGQDQDHWSVGVGLAWPRFQIDAAYDTSDRYKVGSLSMVTRF